MGPTGSGKTGISIKAAKKIGGEIISADSRAIYKGLDIGTAKPLPSDREGVPHFGFDLVEIGERFSAYDYKKYAEEKITEIQARGHRPMVVGGTGLYIDALVYDYKFGPRKVKKDETGEYPDRKEVCINYLLIGVKVDDVVLRQRLMERVNKMFVQELFDECKKLVQRVGEENVRRYGNVYEFAWRYMKGEINLDEAKRLNFYADWHLAKRQMTWFKRNKKIKWMETQEIEKFFGV